MNSRILKKPLSRTVLLGALALFSSTARAQDKPAAGARPANKSAGAPATGHDTVDSINRDFEEQVARLQRQRLDRLARLAASQAKDEAEKTYEIYFQTALSAHLYREAEPVAERVLQTAPPASRLAFLAAVINIIAEADRGAHDESLASLNAAFERGTAGKPGAERALPQSNRILLAEAYYQRLVQADRFDVARKAFQMIKEKAEDPAVEQYAAGRLRQLDMVGKPAPAFTGTDIDGKPIRLEDFKGDVVLLVFWATWYVPAATDVGWLDAAYQAHKARGFRIVGVNLDAMQDGGQKLDAVEPGVRRFLIDHNVRWPNVINLPGESDIAKAYAVSEVPANVLIGRDGKVIHLDLTRANLERVVAKEIGR